MPGSPITSNNQFTLTIRGRQQLVDLNNPTLVKALAADNLDNACAKRTFREKFSDLFADYFGWTKQEDVITTLWGVTKAKDTVAIQNGALKLASLADDPRQFADAFSMKTGRDRLGSPSVDICLAGQCLSSVPLDREAEWDTKYFCRDNNDQSVWRLSDYAVELTTCTNKFPTSSNSVELQSNILDLLIARPNLKEGLTVKVNSTGQECVVTVSFNGQPLAEMLFASAVELDPYLFKKNDETGEFEINLVNFQKAQRREADNKPFCDYRPVFKNLYSSKNSAQELAKKVLADQSVQECPELVRMKQGECLSYQNGDFRQQICKDLPRQRQCLSQEVEREFTQFVIALLKPKLLTALSDSAWSIYKDFCYVPMTNNEGMKGLNRKDLYILLAGILSQDLTTGSTRSGFFSDHPQKDVILAFKNLSIEDKKAFLAIADRNTYFQFKPEELPEDTSQGLSRFALLSSQGIFVSAAQMVQTAKKLIHPDALIVADQNEQQYRDVNLSSQSELTHAWPVTYGAAEQRTPIMRFSTRMSFKTFEEKKLPEDLSLAAEKIESIKSEIDEITKSITTLEEEISDDNKKKQDEKEELARVQSLRTLQLSPTKEKKIDKRRELEDTKAQADIRSVVMKLTQCDLEIELIHPEVANASARIINDNYPAEWINRPCWEVNSNLPASQILQREASSKVSLKARGEEANFYADPTPLSLIYPYF